MPYREKWEDDILDGRSLVQCALDVHMTNIGSFDRLQADHRNDANVLANALMRWKPGSPEHERFDNAVRELIGAALAEFA
jgi:hypothetical protein